MLTDSMSAPPADFSIGDQVVHTHSSRRRGRVVEQSGGRVKVQWADGSEAFIDPSRLRKIEDGVSRVSREDFLADLAILKFDHKFSDVVFSMGSSRTQFLPYQFKPVLQFIQQNPHGLLIADEVGLGKTIEAALIARELIARGSISRILVVCPANLREKWQRELRERFGMEFRFLTGRDFESFRERHKRDGYWPPFRGIVSLQGLRSTKFEETILGAGIPLDLVIVDEAHHMRNPATRSYQLGNALADQADHALLLSATPVQTSEVDLLSLLRILEPAEFDDVSANELTYRLEPNRYLNAATRLLSAPKPEPAAVAAEMERALNTYHGTAFREDAVFMSWLRRLEDVDSLPPESVVRLRRDIQNIHTLAPYYTRTRKVEVQEIAQRQPHTLSVKLTDEEREFYDAWVAFIRTEAVLRRDVHPAFYVVLPERQAASSIHAVRDRVEERIGKALRRQRGTSEDDGYEGSDFIEEQPDEWNGANSGQSMTPIEAAAERLREAAAQLPKVDSKFEKFGETLRELLDEKPDRKVICFTEWRGTLRRLTDYLSRAKIHALAISGDVSPQDRAKRIDQFRNSSDVRVLVSTEVGSEGLDFQFCDTVINFDLPWNPMRVEQRIGRIDRFGQEADRVIVSAFFVKDTIDTRVLNRLYKRIRVFEQSIGQLEPILGPEITSLQRDVLSREITPEEQENRATAAALRIETNKALLEEIDKHQAELMGQGDLLRKEAENARETGRYISADEVRSIVERWLTTGGSKQDRLNPTRRHKVFDLHVSGTKLREVYSWMQSNRSLPTADGDDRQPLLERLQEERHAWVTFDDDLARENPLLPFLHSSHEIVQAALSELGEAGMNPWKSRVGRFRLPDDLQEDPQTADGVLLAIFRITIHGLDEQTTMLPIAVGAASGDILERYSERLLGALSTSEGVSGAGGIDEDAIELCYDFSFEEAQQRTREVEDLTRDLQASRVAVQTASLKRSYSARIRRGEEQARGATDDGIRRMHEGHVRNLGAELADKLARLAKAPEPTAEFDIIAMAAFEPAAP